MLKRIKSLFLAITAVVSSAASAGVTTPLYEGHDQACTVRLEHDAVPGSKGVMVVRLVETNTGDCRLTSSQLADAIGQGIRQFKSRRDLVEIESVFIGRIYRYPWLSAYLVHVAQGDAAWSSKTGRAVKGSSNHYVNRSLYAEKILKPIISELGKYNYRLSGVSCEKVLINDKKLPYDAMCWLSLN